MPLVTIVGVQSLAEYWYQRMYDASDLVFCIEKARIKVSSDGTALYSTTFQMTGTMVMSTQVELKKHEAKIEQTAPCRGEMFHTEVEAMLNR